jgi:hypothetical protein
MSRFRSVLRVRELAERRALGEAAAAQRDVRSAAEARAARVEALAAAVQPAGRALTPLELRTLQLRGLAAHDLVVDAVSEVELAEERHAELVRAWSLASVQRRSVERLAERRRIEAAVAARQAADKALDEIVLLRRGGTP